MDTTPTLKAGGGPPRLGHEFHVGRFHPLSRCTKGKWCAPSTCSHDNTRSIPHSRTRTSTLAYQRQPCDEPGEPWCQAVVSGDSRLQHVAAPIARVAHAIHKQASGAKAYPR